MRKIERGMANLLLWQLLGWPSPYDSDIFYANMSFDEIFVLTAGVYFYFYNILCTGTPLALAY